MRYNAGHSTSCCGAHSFSGFGPAENQNPNIINQTMQQGPVGRLADITLNAGQIRNNPQMMQRLADLGFVLDAHWINSVHRSDVYRFTRCDTRRPLLQGIEDAWRGMVMTAGLTGDLPAVPNAPGGAAGQRVGRLRFRPGDRVRVINRATRRFGREFIIEDCPNGGWDMIARMRDDRENNAMFRLSYDSLELVQAVEARDPVPAAPAPQRHENAEFAVVANAPVPAAPPAPPPAPQPAPQPARIVGRYWHCVFRDGRRGAGYQSFAEATRNLGRRTRIDRFEILSDGTSRWVEQARN